MLQIRSIKRISATRLHATALEDRVVPALGLDSGFLDANGNIRQFDNGGIDGFTAIGRQSDNKVVLGGTATVNGFNQFALRRLNANGQPDSTLGGTGSNGFIRMDLANLRGFGVGNNQLNAMTIDSSNRILVGDGIATIEFVSGSIRFNSLGGSAIAESKGRIIVTDTSFTLGAFLDNGQPDASFGTNGGKSFPFVIQGNSAYGVAIRPNSGSILIGGRESFSGNDYFVARQITPSGNLDTTYGVNGVAKYSFFGGGEQVRAMVANPVDGSVVVVGSALNGNAKLAPTAGWTAPTAFSPKISRPRKTTMNCMPLPF